MASRKPRAVHADELALMGFTAGALFAFLLVCKAVFVALAPAVGL